jgi:transposase InsO family protein
LKPPNPTNAGSPERVTVGDVVASFTDTAATYGLPAATLTDNGSVYTSRFTHGHNDFERLIASLGVTQRNGHPGHPQTQGKIERFHRTLKLWLIRRRRPSTITQAQTQLDDFRGGRVGGPRRTTRAAHDAAAFTQSVHQHRLPEGAELTVPDAGIQADPAERRRRRGAA